MKAKRDSNPRYRTVSVCTKGLILPTIGNANPQYRSNKNLDFAIFQDDYCCNSMVGVEDSNPKGVNTPYLTWSGTAVGLLNGSSSVMIVFLSFVFIIFFSVETLERVGNLNEMQIAVDFSLGELLGRRSKLVSVAESESILYGKKMAQDVLI